MILFMYSLLLSTRWGVPPCGATQTQYSRIRAFQELPTLYHLVCPVCTEHWEEPCAVIVPRSCQTSMITDRRFGFTNVGILGGSNIWLRNPWDIKNNLNFFQIIRKLGKSKRSRRVHIPRYPVCLLTRSRLRDTTVKKKRFFFWYSPNPRRWSFK